jgi:shikimate kinase
MNKNIALVGFMGSGKSVVGRALAERLSLNFADLDEVIEDREKRPITRIFEDSGEAYFRKLEKSLVKEFSSKSGLVIACGGGVVMDEENMAGLKRSGVIVYLKTDPKIIYARTKGKSHRPLLNVGNQEERIAGLLDKRRPFYEKADYTVDTSDKDVAGVVEDIIKIIKP